MNPLRTLLHGVIDYAGLFPPAGLAMRPAVENYAAYLKSDCAWMLGRFIVPVSRLPEFEAATRELKPDRTTWRLTALCSPNTTEDGQQIEAFNGNHKSSEVPQIAIDAVELKTSTVDDILKNGFLTESYTTYFETPIESDPEPLIKSISDVKGRAKVRTGGIYENLFPKSIDLIRFMVVCKKFGVPFKATAGLHHPFRGTFPLTYEPGSPSTTMFGFMNLWLAAGFLLCERAEDEVLKVLDEKDPGMFSVDDKGISWNGQRVTIEQLRSLRENVAISFGSCSFLEPVNELRELGLL